MSDKEKEMSKQMKLLLEKYGDNALDLEELENVAGGSWFWELAVSDYCWRHLVALVEPNLKKYDFKNSWTLVDMKFERRNGKNVYTDTLTGKEVDFARAWSLALKRFQQKYDCSRPGADKAFSNIYEMLGSTLS